MNKYSSIGNIYKFNNEQQRLKQGFTQKDQRTHETQTTTQPRLV